MTPQMTHELKMKSLEELGNGLHGRATALGPVHVRGLQPQQRLESTAGRYVPPPGAQGPSPLSSPRGRLGDPEVKPPPGEKEGERNPEGRGCATENTRKKRSRSRELTLGGDPQDRYAPGYSVAGTQEGDRQLLPSEFEGLRRAQIPQAVRKQVSGGSGPRQGAGDTGHFGG